jgi:tetratricopeptide (TPR) repeat protein
MSAPAPHLSEPQMAALLRTSKKAAVLSALGALIVMSAFGIAGYMLWEVHNTNQDSVSKEAYAQQLDQLRTGESNAKRKLAQAEKDTQVAQAAAQAAQATAQAAQSAATDLTDRIAAAPTPASLQQLQAQVAPGVPAPTTPRDKARAEWRAGLAIRDKDLAAAYQHFKAAIAADQTYAAPYNSLGRLAFDAGKLDDAKAYYEQALQQSPVYTPALYNLALISQQQLRIEDARRYAHQALELQPDDAKMHKLLDSLDASEPPGNGSGSAAHPKATAVHPAPPPSPP